MRLVSAVLLYRGLRGRRKRRQRHNRQRLTEQPLNIPQQRPLIGRYERNCSPTSTGPRGAADSVNVVFRDVGQFVVDDVRQLFDIETTSGNLSRNQGHDFIRLEVRESAHTRCLTLVAVNGSRGNSASLQLLREAVCSVLRAGEHQDLVPVVLPDQVRQQMALLVL